MMGNVANDQTEQNFYKTILTLYNIEIQLNNLLPDVINKSNDNLVRHKIGRLQNYANLQLQRIEEIFDIYEIPMEDNQSLEIISLNNEIKNSLFEEDTLYLKNSEILHATENIKNQEVILINTSLNLANRLGYTEAEEILSDALVSEERINGYLLKNLNQNGNGTRKQA